MTDRLTCSIPSCDSTPKTRGWCAKHYERWRRRGDPLEGALDSARFPFGDLERLVAVQVGPEPTARKIGQAIGASRDYVAQLRHRRRISAAVADRLATAAGYHPAEVWPEWLEEAS